MSAPASSSIQWYGLDPSPRFAIGREAVEYAQVVEQLQSHGRSPQSGEVQPLELIGGKDVVLVALQGDASVSSVRCAASFTAWLPVVGLGRFSFSLVVHSFCICRYLVGEVYPGRFLAICGDFHACAGLHA